MKPNWTGVSSQFKPDFSIDFSENAAMCENLIKEGVHGIIVNGTIGDNCSLTPEEKRIDLSKFGL